MLGLGMMLTSLLWPFRWFLRSNRWQSIGTDLAIVVGRSDIMSRGTVGVIVLMGCFFALVPFSNSFVMEEPSIVFVLWQTLTLVIWLHHCIDNTWREHRMSGDNRNHVQDILVHVDWFQCGRGAIVLGTQRLLWSVSVSLYEQPGVYSSVLVPLGLLSLGIAVVMAQTLATANQRTEDISFILTMQCVVAVQLALSHAPLPMWRSIGQVYLPRAILLVCICGVIAAMVWKVLDRKRGVSVWILAATTVYALYCTSFVNQLVFVSWTCTCYATISLPTAASGATTDYLRRYLTAFWCLVAGRWLFFATQHRCQFNRLQLTVAFIGHREFSVLYGGWALAANTMGHDWMLSLLVQHWSLPSSMCRSRESLSLRMFARLWLILLTCIAAYHLRRHLMLWAIFAPKVRHSATRFLTNERVSNDFCVTVWCVFSWCLKSR